MAIAAIVALALGFALVVCGVALVSVPAALIVGGVALAAWGLFADTDTKRGGGK